MSKSWFAEYLAKAVEGPEHQALRKELWIGGADSACRYYLSMLTNQDYFSLPLRDLWRDVAEYVVRHASRGAVAFAHNSTPEISEFALPFLRQQFDQAFGIDQKLTKAEQGMILLLEHPEWTDEQIRIAVNTTEKQMNRWPWYRRARAVQSWHEREKRR